MLWVLWVLLQSSHEAIQINTHTKGFSGKAWKIITNYHQF